MVEDGKKELELTKKIEELMIKFNEKKMKLFPMPLPLEDLKLKDKGGKAQNLMTWKFDPALKKDKNRGRA